MKVVLSAWSVRKLEEYYNYLNALNPHAAEKNHNRLLDGIERLAAQPLMGRVEPTLEHHPAGFRSLVIGKRYKAIYIVKQDTVYIVDIWDCRRDPVRLVDEMMDNHTWN